jgi:hypothetical protein
MSTKFRSTYEFGFTINDIKIGFIDGIDWYSPEAFANPDVDKPVSVIVKKFAIRPYAKFKGMPDRPTLMYWSDHYNQWLPSTVGVKDRRFYRTPDEAAKAGREALRNLSNRIVGYLSA